VAEQYVIEKFTFFYIFSSLSFHLKLTETEQACHY